jgi:hypothetical protein
MLTNRVKLVHVIKKLNTSIVYSIDGQNVATKKPIKSENIITEKQIFKIILSVVYILQ